MAYIDPHTGEIKDDKVPLLPRCKECETLRAKVEALEAKLLIERSRIYVLERDLSNYKAFSGEQKNRIEDLKGRLGNARKETDLRPRDPLPPHRGSNLGLDG